MQKSELGGLLLFSMERGRYPYRYRLYFAELDTIDGKRPVIHRLKVNSRRRFFSFALGGIYNISCSRITIKTVEHTGSYNLSDMDYYRLVDARDLLFLDDKSARFIGLADEQYDPREYYYSFSAYRQLLEYAPPFWNRALVNGCKLIVYLLCLFIPVALYLLFLFSISNSLTGSGTLTVSRVFAVPIAALGTFPFLLWMMTAVYAVSETLLLNIRSLRYHMLRSYALRWAGMRKSCYIEPSQKRALLKSGLITGGIFLVTLLLVLFVL